MRLAANADLLVYDTTVLDPPGSPAGLYALHTSPQRIGEVAAAANVKALLLSHLSPIVEQKIDEVVRSVRTHYHGVVQVAADRMCVTLE